MTRLDKPLRRELVVDGHSYTLTIDPTGLKLAKKGHRRGVAIDWQDLLNGDAALAAALKASLSYRVRRRGFRRKPSPAGHARRVVAIAAATLVRLTAYFTASRRPGAVVASLCQHPIGRALPIPTKYAFSASGGCPHCSSAMPNCMRATNIRCRERVLGGATGMRSTVLGLAMIRRHEPRCRVACVPRRD
jgi:hypothetical protein